MTVQFTPIDTADSRLLTDSFGRSTTDSSFEDKLQYEQARLGLMFSPFGQLQQTLLNSFNFFRPFDFDQQINSYVAQQEAPAPSDNNLASNQPSSLNRPATAVIFESAPLQYLNKQALQQILTQTSWLIPNLESQPQFFQASLQGQLAPTYNLQALIDEIISQIKVAQLKNGQQLTLTLQPEELGEIILTLTSHLGAVTIQITADPETKKLIDSQKAELVQALKKAHLQIDQIEIREVEKNA